VLVATQRLSTVEVADRAVVIVDGRMITDTLEGMLQNQNAWIHEYFHGPRARAAEKGAHG